MTQPLRTAVVLLHGIYVWILRRKEIIFSKLIKLWQSLNNIRARLIHCKRLPSIHRIKHLIRFAERTLRLIKIYYL